MAPCLLLLLAESPSHGYQLTERLKDFGFPGGSPSRLYRDLRRLEEAGLVASYWESTQHCGPARRVYELTPSGVETLGDCAQEAERLVGRSSATCGECGRPAGEGRSGGVRAHVAPTNDSTTVGSPDAP